MSPPLLQRHLGCPCKGRPTHSGPHGHEYWGWWPWWNQSKSWAGDSGGKEIGGGCCGGKRSSKWASEPPVISELPEWAVPPMSSVGSSDSGRDPCFLALPQQRGPASHCSLQTAPPSSPGSLLSIPLALASAPPGHLQPQTAPSWHCVCPREDLLTFSEVPQEENTNCLYSFISRDGAQTSHTGGREQDRGYGLESGTVSSDGTATA